MFGKDESNQRMPLVQQALCQHLKQQPIGGHVGLAEDIAGFALRDFAQRLQLLDDFPNARWDP